MEILLFVTSKKDEMAYIAYLESAYPREYARGLSQSPSTECTIKLIVDRDCTNPGDALRSVDKLNIVQSNPFLLLHNPIISNVDLAPVLDNFKKRTSKGDGGCMTCLFSSRLPNSRHPDVGYDGREIYLGTDSLSKEILLYHAKPKHLSAWTNSDDRPKMRYDMSNTIPIPTSFLHAYNTIEIHPHVSDIGIDVCSPEVLARFSDEFDYREVRKQFVANSVAEEEEGLRPKIFAHLIGDNEYCCAVRDFRTYDAVSRDVIRRRCYPVVVDAIESNSVRKFKYSRHFVYRESKVGNSIDRTTEIGRGCVVGAAVKIGKSGVMKDVVFGDSTVVGDGARISNSHLFEGVQLGDNVTVNGALIGQNAVIKSNAVIHHGVVIGDNCVIGENVNIDPFTHIVCGEDEIEDEDSDDGFDDDGTVDEDKVESQFFETDEAVVGVGGRGRIFVPRVDDSDSDSDEDLSDDSDDMGGIYRDHSIKRKLIHESQSIGFSPDLIVETDGLLDARYNTANNSDDDDDQDDLFFGGGDDTELNFGNNNNNMLITGRQKGVDIILELKNLCLEHEEGASLENLAIELNSFKFSQNASYVDCNRAAMLAAKENAEKEVKDNVSSLSAMQAVMKFRISVGNFKVLFNKLSPRVDDQLGVVLGLEEICSETEDNTIGAKLGSQGFMIMLRFCYEDLEILSEECINHWAEKRSGGEGDEGALALFKSNYVQQFLEWLAESEEEDSSDEDESD